MKRTKLSMLFVLVCATNLPIIAATIVSSEKLPDGSKINWCRFENGKVEYCTLQDSLKDLDRLHNPTKYMTDKEKKEFLKYEEYGQQAKKDFPIINKMASLKDTYEQELNKLKSKQRYGVTIDTEKLDLLSFKINLLTRLENETSYSEDEFIMGYEALQRRYSETLQAKDNKILTEEEFKEAKIKFQKEARVLEAYYNKITSLNTLPNDTNVYSWIQINNVDYNPVKKVKQRIIENTLDTYVPADAKLQINRFLNKLGN